MTFDLNPTQTLAMALGVLYLGSFVIARVAFLRDNNIPVPVVGGILFARFWCSRESVPCT
jgi:ESS family glutamate:Na+ symporter